MKIVIGIIGLIVLGYLIFGGSATDSEVVLVEDKATTPTATDVAEIVVLDQKAGDVLLVQSVTLLTDGYVVAHRNKEGTPGEDIGNSVLLPKGASLNVGVPLDEGITLEDGESVFMMLHDDDGDGEYAFPGPDTPTILNDGRIVVQLITVSNEVPSGEVLETSALNDKDTTASGPTLISYDSNGFSPASITIKVGDTVVFENEGTKKMWVASSIHPTHRDLPGFDNLKSVDGGGKYSYTFEKAGAWKYHNHVRPGDTGIITVK